MTYLELLKILLPFNTYSDSSQSEVLKDISAHVEGLKKSEENADALFNEIFPDISKTLIPSWEKLCGLTVGAKDIIQLRRDRVITKLREKGGCSIEYFTALALMFGYTITIEELKPFMAGWGRAGDTLYAEESIFIWSVNILNSPNYYFRAGQSVAGERLAWWNTQLNLEDLFNKLKQAHTYVTFVY